MKRVLAQIRKELTQTVRDRLSLALALVLPMMMLALMGNALSLDVKDLPIVVQDLDQTPLSRQYVEMYRQSLTFRVVPASANGKPEEALLASRARAAILIPPDFERDLRRGWTTEVQVLVDATDSNTANLVKGNVAALSQALVQTLGIAPRSTPAIQTQSRLWFNPGRVAKKFYAPGILVICLSLFPPLFSVMWMAREGEEKTIIQVYASSISAHEYLLGKVLACMIVGISEWILLMLLSAAMFGLAITGDPMPLIVTTLVFLFCVVSYGAMIGVAIPNQPAAIQVLAITGFLFALLLSGLIFPIDNIPAAIRWISGFVPARYYIEVLRDSFLRGATWSTTLPDLSMIALLGTAFFGLAWLKLRRMQVAA
jgi:ABC-2 type transport system permease protein